MAPSYSSDAAKKVESLVSALRSHSDRLLHMDLGVTRLPGLEARMKTGEDRYAEPLVRLTGVDQAISSRSALIEEGAEKQKKMVKDVTDVKW
jgi:hypothetical protein